MSPASGAIPRRAAGPLLWALLLLAAGGGLLAYHLTGTAPTGAASAPGAPAQVEVKIDQALARDQALNRAAESSAALADTVNEQQLAAQAQHFGDELVDISFTIALEQATLAAAAAPPPVAGSEAAEDNARVLRQREAVAADQTALSALAPTAPEREVAAAQLALDQARLTDAVNDAARAATGGGSRLRQLFEEHTAARTAAQQTAATLSSRQAAESAARDPAGARGLVGRLHAALLLNEKARTLAADEAAARAAQAQVAATHDRLLAALHQQEAAQKPGAATVASLNGLAERQKQISRFDQQDDLDTELADIYQAWAPVAQSQRRAALHAALQSWLWLLGVLAALLLLVETVERIFNHQRFDRKRAATLRHILRLAAQVLALVAGLIIAFGQPSQILTVIGLCGAGLTVAFQDAILSAAGWFVLMGRHGVRLGNWVEIQGVNGEVAEITLLKTVMVETGNWMTVGHRTGRRVFFPNSYALKGSYFNYTTGGQWLWDELVIQPPPGVPAATVLDSVRTATAAALEEIVTQARSQGLKPPPEPPQALLRPLGNGVEVLVRYSVPAAERTAARERIYRALATLKAETAGAPT